MRLKTEQARIIKQIAADIFGSGTRVWLFGSRADDSKRGGDIDLLIAPASTPITRESDLRRKIRFLGRIERQLGEQKIDVVIEAPDDTRPIVRVAHETGLEL